MKIFNSLNKIHDRKCCGSLIICKGHIHPTETYNEKLFVDAFKWPELKNNKTNGKIKKKHLMNKSAIKLL